MKKIETNSHYSYSKLFEAEIDKSKLSCKTVGKDISGNFILHISETCNIGSAYSTADEYFRLTAEEYRQYIEKARANKLISWLEQRRLLRELEKAEPPRGAIESFERVTLRTSGMRFTAEHEIVMNGSKAEVSRYGIRYRENADERILEERAEVSEASVLKLLNDCRILSWDGFHGAHPRGVLDGTMFSFEAVLNSGKRIRAEGSENFPKHYREFTDSIYKMLKGEIV